MQIQGGGDMMKKMMRLLLIIVIISAVFIGCAGGPENTDAGIARQDLNYLDDVLNEAVTQMIDTLAVTGEKVNIAIQQIDIGAGVGTENDIEGKIIKAITEDNRLGIIAMDKLKEIAVELVRQSGGSTDEETKVDVGEHGNAHYFIYCKTFFTGKTLNFSLQAVDVQTAGYAFQYIKGFKNEEFDNLVAYDIDQTLDFFVVPDLDDLRYTDGVSQDHSKTLSTVMDGIREIDETYWTKRNYLSAKEQYIELKEKYENAVTEAMRKNLGQIDVLFVSRIESAEDAIVIQKASEYLQMAAEEFQYGEYENSYSLASRGYHYLQGENVHKAEYKKELIEEMDEFVDKAADAAKRDTKMVFDKARDEIASYLLSDESEKAKEELEELWYYLNGNVFSGPYVGEYGNIAATVKNVTDLAGKFEKMQSDPQYDNRKEFRIKIAGDYYIENDTYISFYRNPRITDGELRKIKYFINLQTLSLRSRDNVTDLGPLAGLTNLQSLDLSWCDNVADLGPLSDLTNLQSLDIMRCDSISDLGPLAGLINLQTLSLRSCANVADLGPLAGLTNLQELDLRYCDNITSEQVEKLRKQLPNADIRF
jgi:hypothetical protein